MYLQVLYVGFSSLSAQTQKSTGIQTVGLYDEQDLWD